MKEPGLQRHWPRLGNPIVAELSTFTELVSVDHGLCVFTTSHCLNAALERPSTMSSSRAGRR